MTAAPRRKRYYADFFVGDRGLDTLSVWAEDFASAERRSRDLCEGTALTLLGLDPYWDAVKDGRGAVVLRAELEQREHG